MRKKLTVVLSLVVTLLSIFATSAFAEDNDNTNNNLPSHIEKNLPNSSTEDISSRAGGTAVSMTSDVWKTSSGVWSSAYTICSQPCAIVTADNTAYQGANVLAFDSDHGEDVVSAIVNQGPFTYISTKSYSCVSNHYAENYYGVSSLDSTGDYLGTDV